ncbi:MAG TPA: hypothetical protein VI837_00970 [Blastocatellia bacterium]|nr:hypothetical protein [Blastocatellia bacterium]
MIDELEFNSRVIDRGAESADILRDSSAGKLSFLPKELRGEINSVYGLLSSAKKLGESLKKDQAESAPRDFGQLDSTFAQLRALIPPILQRLLKEAPKKP